MHVCMYFVVFFYNMLSKRYIFFPFSQRYNIISPVSYLCGCLTSFMALYSCVFRVTGKGRDVTFNENPKLVGCVLGLDVSCNLFATLYIPTPRKRP